jgi:hypothetical protein
LPSDASRQDGIADLSAEDPRLFAAFLGVAQTMTGGADGTRRQSHPWNCSGKSALEVVPNPSPDASPAVVELGAAMARALVAALGLPEVREALVDAFEAWACSHDHARARRSKRALGPRVAA